MASASSDSDFEGFTIDDIEDINENKSILTSDESDIDISDYSSGEEDFDNENNTDPQHNLPPDAQPLDYLFLFLPEGFLFENVAEETNKYAQHLISVRRRNDPLWQPSNTAEMRAFFTINIMFGVKQLHRLWNYWSPDVRYGDPYISSIMSKTRYSKISQYLHLTDSANAPNKNDPNYDSLYKVRPVIDLLVNNYKTVYLPRKNLSVDEAMIGYKDRVHFRQYMPAKPTKLRIKVREVCESETGYCVNFDVYTKLGVRSTLLSYININFSSIDQNLEYSLSKPKPK
ncbi:piggyBac transposable element-derived protein 4-like [Octopus sinensis]|uniref:PiggyBac transposable element-derived protein 4-like n=1 Tax=Octopus sinensis TaxID=2607531 RepID=A0A6P7S6B6_9MOLL|nr:piggyBac transposable element-derived protein 4-like [Octopus sinensis]